MHTFRRHGLLTHLDLADTAAYARLADGFFDAGVLLQALKARREDPDKGETKPSARAVVQARRREVGKKLRLVDY